MKIYVIDNYDSFTFNLVHYVEMYCKELKVVRNNMVNIKDIEDFDKILLSPGPGLPSEVPVLNEVLKNFAGKKSILGVCLGMQAIAEFYGGELYNLPNIVHGVPSNTVVVKDDYLFNGIARNFNSGRYHSWAVDKKSLPSDIDVTAIDNDGVLMAIAHKHHDIRAVQFHPESIMTEFGHKIIENWVNYDGCL